MTSITINTVIIKSLNIKTLSKFYQQGLELPEPQAYGDDHIGFALEGAYLGFDEVTEPVKAYPGAISLWFRVDDIAESFDRLKHLGAGIGYPPTEKPWGDRLAAVFDPDGNMIGLVQKQDE